MMMCIQNLVLFCQFVLKILSKNQILTSIKGRNSVANLRKTMIYNTNLDLVTDNVYTNFGLILSIRSQDIEQKPNFDVNQGPLLSCQFAKNNEKQPFTIPKQILSMIMCIQNLVLIGLFVFKIFSKNSILTLIKGSNSVANLLKLELIQAFMHVLLTCKNDVDQIKNEGARVFTRFLPL